MTLQTWLWISIIFVFVLVMISLGIVWTKVSKLKNEELKPKGETDADKK